jgi:hypothetical protein
MRLLVLAALAVASFTATMTYRPADANAYVAVRGAYGGAAVRGPYGAAAVRGPGGGAAVRGPRGGVAVRR